MTCDPAQAYPAMGDTAADGVIRQAETFVIGPAIWPVFGCLSKTCGMAMTCCTSIGLLVPQKPMYQMKNDKLTQWAPNKP